jgi:hypothetical protein
MGRGVAGWRNKAIAPYKASSLRVLHDSVAAETAIHCLPRARPIAPQRALLGLFSCN